jgi:hypothetical protein
MSISSSTSITDFVASLPIDDEEKEKALQLLQDKGFKNVAQLKAFISKRHEQFLKYALPDYVSMEMEEALSQLSISSTTTNTILSTSAPTLATKPSPNTELGDHLKIDVNDLVKQQLLGKGSSGEVWKCKWNGKGAGAIVAVKFIHVPVMNSQIESTCMQEVTLMTRLNHINLIRVLGYGVSQFDFFIVMEYFEGNSLFHFIHKNKPLSPLVICHMGKQMVQAIHYIHKSNLVHRDIKALNFLVSSERRYH